MLSLDQPRKLRHGSADRCFTIILNFIGGELLGIVLTFGYVRYSWTLPEVTQLPGKFTEMAIVTAAKMDVFSPEAADDLRRRALSIVMSHQAGEFVEIDHELGVPLMAEVLRRKAFHETKLLKHQMTAYEVAMDKPALRQALERKHSKTNYDAELKRRMLLSAIHDREFSSWYLHKRFTQLTERDWIDLVLNVYVNEFRPETCVAVEKDAAPL